MSAYRTDTIQKNGSAVLLAFPYLVCTATIYVQKALGLSVFAASLFPAMVFVWPLILSFPAEYLMEKIGIKNSAAISVVTMLVSMLIPLFGDSYALMLVSFALLGAANAVLFRSVNALLCDIFYSDSVESVYNSGFAVMSFTKLSASLIAPWGAMHIAMTFGLGWRIVFLIYAVVCLLALISVVATRTKGNSHIRSLYIDFSLLRRPSILQYFIGEVCISGMYVGIFVFAPIILNDRLGLDVNSAVFGATILCLGCIVSVCVIRYLAKSMSERLQYVLGLLLMGSGLLMLLLCGSQSMLCIGLFLIGCGNPMSDLMHSQAAKVVDGPKIYLYDTFELCSVGRVIFPLLMGAVAEVSGISGAVLVVCAAFVYLLSLAFKIKRLFKN